mmetsp:Transcript_20594/g.30922  ORF Transcript_20594/g.30922 Transcript_20594/m.30922 type:complete len:316 (-) Transcript_20594:121-1068(-)
MFFSKLQSDAELVSTLHKQQFVQPSNTTSQNTHTIITTFLLILTTHIILINLINKQKVAKKLELSSYDEVMKLSYQATNLLVNLSLGVYGFYTIMYSFPSTTDKSFKTLLFPSYEPNILERITGYNAYTHFSSYQLAYNAWALPVGIFLVDENKIMLLHHVSVLTSTSLACYTNLGYKIFSVYIFGCAELSSVPLAIMNFLRDRPEFTRRYLSMTILYGIVKNVFAGMFLLLRVIIATPMILDLLRSSALVLYTSFWNLDDYVNVGALKIGVCSFNFVLMSILGFLQYYWASLIVKALAKSVVGGGDKKTKKKAE